MSQVPKSKPTFAPRGASIRVLLLSSLLTILALLLLIAALNYIFASRLNRALATMKQETARTNAALKVNKAASDLLTALAQGTLTRDADDFAQEVSKASQALSDAEDQLAESTAALPLDDPLRIQLYGLEASSKDMQRLAELLPQRAREGKWWQIEQFERSLIPYYRSMMLESVEQMRLATTERRASAVAQVDTASRIVQTVPMVIALLVVGTATVAVLIIVRSIARPIERLTRAATRLAAGHMEERVDVEQVAEFSSLAAAFNEMSDQLQVYYTQLEQRVAERTRGLQTAAEVSRAITSVLDPDELLDQVVNLACERFGLYYVGLFLVDKEQEFAILRAGTGEAGKNMLEQGHKLGVGSESMIGQCVILGEPRITQDTGDEAVRFVNPYLPDTRSELALPLRARGQVIGAMTVQSVEEAAFDETNIAVLQTMADQVAVALDNARLFDESQTALKEMEGIQHRYLGQAWAEYLQSTQTTGYETEHPTLPLLGDTILPQIQQAITQKSTVTQQSYPHASASPHSALVTPIALRGAVIGALGIHDDDETRQWSDEEVALVDAIAERMALAAENLRLLDETQRRAAHEQLVGRISSRVRSSLDPDTILKTTVQELGRALGTRLVTIEVTGPGENGGDSPAEATPRGSPVGNPTHKEEE